jgi:hypothetical protein
MATLLPEFAWMEIFPPFLPFASMGFASMGEHQCEMGDIVNGECCKLNVRFLVCVPVRAVRDNDSR